MCDSSVNKCVAVSVQWITAEELRPGSAVTSWMSGSEKEQAGRDDGRQFIISSE